MASCVAVPYPELALLVGVLLLATLCAHGLARWRPPEPPAAYAAIDGLRGYLALMVFVHHGAVWWGYLHTGQWRPPPSRLMNNLGEGSVALFFMITALLFGGLHLLVCAPLHAACLPRHRPTQPAATPPSPTPD